MARKGKVILVWSKIFIKNHKRLLVLRLICHVLDFTVNVII